MRDIFIDKCDDLMSPIIAYLVCIAYERNHGKNEEIISHWKHEIDIWASKILSWELMHKLSSKSMRKLIDKVYDRIDAFSIRTQYGRSRVKLEDEGFPKEVKVIEEVNQQVNEYLVGLKDVLVTYDFRYLDDWLDKI